MIVAETQQIVAGSQFNGAAPASSVTKRDRFGELVYDPTTTGGLFTLHPQIDGDPEADWMLRLVKGIRIKFGAQTSWSLSVTDGVTDTVWKSGTNEASFFLEITEMLELLPGEKLKLVTVGASTAMKATVVFQKSRLSGPPVSIGDDYQK